MVNRIIKPVLEEGSNTLPSVLKINKGGHFLVDTVNGSGLYQGKVFNATVLDGAIGNNYNEFTVDFFADDAESMTDGIKRLYYSMINDIFITLKKDLQITRYFKVYKIDDMSYQAMTMNNYDFFIKVFKYADTAVIENDSSYSSLNKLFEEEVTVSSTKYAVKYEKVSSNSIAIIKSYTTKEAWILIDKVITNNSTDKFKLVLDFTYKFFKDETNNKLRFPNVNTYSNVQDLFNVTELSSPYYDRYTFSNATQQNMAFLNQQSEYITRSVNELFSLTGVNKDFTLKTIPNITVNALRINPDTFDLNRFKQQTVFDKNEVIPYLLSLSYEVYGYVTKTSSFGTRCFYIPADGKYARFEVYPILPGTVHYMYEIQAVGNKPLLSEITEKTIRNLLKAKNIYLYNYLDLSYNTFIDNNKLFVDIYSYVPYEYEAANSSFIANFDDYTPSNISIVDLTLPSTYSGNTVDYRSRFDLTRSYERTYACPYNLNENDYQLAYFGNDVFIKTIIDNFYSSDSTTCIPQIFSNDIDLLEQKKGNVLDRYFDILSNGDNFTTIQSENVIDPSTVIQEFTDLGIRENYNTFKIKNIMENVESDMLILCKNLSALLPPNVTSLRTPVVAMNDIRVDDCMFLFIENISRTKYLNLTLKYDNAGVIYKAYRSYDPNGGKFIIPYEPDLVYINCAADNCFYYVMK